MGQPDPPTTPTEAGTPPVLIFDEDGDLRLEVGNKDGPDCCSECSPSPPEAQTFVVCSKALARASKPFKAMLYGGFSESKPRGGDAEWTVALPEDDPRALATIMYIIHNSFAMVPGRMAQADLFKLTVLTDKYDMTEVLRPWAHIWIAPLVKRQSTEHVDQLLWISWVLGHKTLFIEMVKQVQDGCDLNPLNQLCYPSGQVLEDNVYVRSLGIVGMLRLAVLALSSQLSCLPFCQRAVLMIST